MKRHNEAWQDSLRYRRPDLDLMSLIGCLSAPGHEAPQRGLAGQSALSPSWPRSDVSDWLSFSTRLWSATMRLGRTVCAIAVLTWTGCPASGVSPSTVTRWSAIRALQGSLRPSKMTSGSKVHVYWHIFIESGPLAESDFYQSKCQDWTRRATILK